MTNIYLSDSLSASLLDFYQSGSLSASLPPRKAADVQSVALEKEKEEAPNRESVAGEKKTEEPWPCRKFEHPEEKRSNTKVARGNIKHQNNYRRTGRPELGGCL